MKTGHFLVAEASVLKQGWFKAIDMHQLQQLEGFQVLN